ncbi:MAG: hypothetical protein IJY99_00055 [Alphaproteobacteria bacterium]|nr:hypothetical protein [Alphaproteobacteria bacterium]
MSRIKKFWILFLSFLPLSAGALAPFAVAGIAGATVITGFSIYRSMAPVDMADALKFFSSCWSCQMFSDVMSVMSGILPGVYHAIGKSIVPMAIILSSVWFIWKVASGFINSKLDSAWSLASDFGVHLLKLGTVIILLAAPLPRMISQIAIEPIFAVGLSLNRIAVHDDNFDACVVATAIADPLSIDEKAAEKGAYSPKFRHNLACELAGVHQMTGLGMTVGWTMLNMSFDEDYMHKLMWAIPIFPNIPIFFAGLMVLVLFFMALLPIPVYFLEIFIKLSMDLVMLPLMLLAWLFKGWKISLAGAGKTIKGIVDDVVSGTLGLALTGIFLSFSIMFMNAVFGDWNGATVLSQALTTGDSKFFMDALMMRNDSLITIMLMGAFMAMFMTSIPALVKTLFSVSISTDFYDTATKNIKTFWGGIKKLYKKS